MNETFIFFKIVPSYIQHTYSSEFYFVEAPLKALFNNLYPWNDFSLFGFIFVNMSKNLAKESLKK